MTLWTFHQSGCIPGVPGTFAGVMVDVDDATNTIRSVEPLLTHAEFLPAPEDDDEETQPLIEDTPPPEKKSKAATPAQIVTAPADPATGTEKEVS